MTKYTFAKDKREVDNVRGEYGFPPSRVSRIGAVDLGKRIKSMLEHGKLVAENLTEQGEYDEETPLKIDGSVDYSALHNSNAEVDDLNDISLDKIDMLEKRDNIISRIKESEENVDKALSDIKKSSENSLKKTKAKGTSEPDKSGSEVDAAD